MNFCTTKHKLPFKSRIENKDRRRTIYLFAVKFYMVIKSKGKRKTLWNRDWHKYNRNLVGCVLYFRIRSLEPNNMIKPWDTNSSAWICKVCVRYQFFFICAVEIAYFLCFVDSAHSRVKERRWRFEGMRNKLTEHSSTTLRAPLKCSS